MQGHEIRSLADLAGEGTRVLTTLVRDTHRGIARRVFDSIGPASKPVQVIHDTTASTVYTLVDGAVRGSLYGAGALAAETLSSNDDPTVLARPRVAGALAAVNGIYGDQLTNRRNGFALTMQIRRRGQPVALDPESIADAFPKATGRIVVFTHGWCMTERSWWRPPRPLTETGETLRPYGKRLRKDLGFTPVFLRYNSGLHISQNGRALADLLNQLHASWPVPLDEVALVGHSMGGLVARSGCHYGIEHEHAWTGKVRHVVCLGSPHLGAGLEKGVNAASWALAKLPETRGLASFLNTRSVGVKDLRYGSLLDEDWLDSDPDEFLQDRCREVPFLPDAVYHFVSSTAAPRAVGMLVGDALVRPKSASGRGNYRTIPFEEAHGLTLTGLNHFDLLNHPLIYDKLLAWLG